MMDISTCIQDTFLLYPCADGRYVLNILEGIAILALIALRIQKIEPIKLLKTVLILIIALVTLWIASVVVAKINGSLAHTTHARVVKACCAGVTEPA